MLKNLLIVVLLAAVIGLPVWYHFETKKTMLKNIKPPEKMEFTITKKTPTQKGYLLVAPNTYVQTELMIIEMATGRVVYKKHLDAEVHEFTQWRINGKTYYSYAPNEADPFPKVGVFVPAGPIVWLDSAMNEICKLKVLPFDDITAKSKAEMDPHDMIVISEDHFINLVSHQKVVTNIPDSLKPYPNKKVYATVVQERKGGKVIWQWDATKFPEFYAHSHGGNNFKDSLVADYTHVNTLTLDSKDSNLILSFRSTDQIIKVSRKTGEILWRLGGENSDFPMTEDMVFSGQHAVKLVDNGQTLQFVDNGDADTRPYTRIAEFQLDEKNRTIKKYSSYKVPHKFVPTRGNVSKIGENLLICGGTSNYVVLVDPKTDRYLFEMHSNWNYYRAHLVDSVYGLEKNTVSK